MDLMDCILSSITDQGYKVGQNLNLICFFVRVALTKKQSLLEMSTSCIVSERQRAFKEYTEVKCTYCFFVMQLSLNLNLKKFI